MLCVLVLSFALLPSTLYAVYAVYAVHAVHAVHAVYAVHAVHAVHLCFERQSDRLAKLQTANCVGRMKCARVDAE